MFENLCLQPHKVTHSTAYSWPTAKNKWKCPRPRGYTDPKPWTFERVFYYCCCVEEWNIDDVTSVYTLTTFRLSCALGYKPTPHGINTPPPRSDSACPPRACRSSYFYWGGVSCVVRGVWCQAPGGLCCCKFNAAFETAQPLRLSPDVVALRPLRSPSIRRWGVVW